MGCAQRIHISLHCIAKLQIASLNHTFSCACEILPTFCVLGAPEPFGTPAALASNTDATPVLQQCSSVYFGCLLKSRPRVHVNFAVLGTQQGGSPDNVNMCVKAVVNAMSTACMLCSFIAMPQASDVKHNTLSSFSDSTKQYTLRCCACTALTCSSSSSFACHRTA